MPTPPRFAVPADLQSLFALFGARRYADMEALANALLQRYPDDGNVWKALSVARQVQHRDAVPALRRAIALLPRDAELRSNLGAILSDAGQLEEAIVAYGQALAVNPDFADAHGNLGVALNRLGRHVDAAASLRRALQLKPAFPEAQYNLGNAVLAQAGPGDALPHYERALALRPGFADAHRGRGKVLLLLDRGEQAAAAFRAALAINGADAQAHAGLAEVEHRAGRLDLAAVSYRRALTLKPTPVWHFNLGNVLADAALFEQAVAAFRQAVALQPDYLAAIENLGTALQRLGQADAAVACHRQALALATSTALDASAVPAVLDNLGNALMAAGQPEQALQHYRRAIAIAPAQGQARHNLARALRQLGRIDEALDQFRLVVARDPGNFAAHSDLLFVQNFVDYLPPGRRLDDARAFAVQATATAPAPTLRAPRRKGALRIGLVSADLRSHPVGYFAQAPLTALADLGRDRIALYVYANSGTRDAVSTAIAAACTGWRDISMLDDAAAAALVADDAIDILIDLGGHTANNRLPLFARRPAPVQLSWLGYCASTGMREIDYMLIDRHLACEGAAAQFVESLWPLPETFLCFTPPPLDLAVAPLPALAGSGITFGCFNNLTKLNEPVIALWSRLLLAVPDSTLLLKAPQLGAPAARTAIVDQFGAHGVDPSRLRLEGASARVDYLAAYRQLDIALDPFPYPGGTTSVEGLWMGVPVLTLAGSRPLARQGVSILRNLGLDEWIADNEDDFLERARRHAADLGALAALRAGLRQRLLSSPLCDAPRFAGHLLAALTAMADAAGIG